MISLVKNWKGTVTVQDQVFENGQQAVNANLQLSGPFTIKLSPVKQKTLETANKLDIVPDTKEDVVVTVKKYMTQKSSPEFDFMAKWNNDVPMPLRTMVGHRVKETRGMVYMELHGDILQEKTFTCMCCGRKLTNPVSQYFGIGPECGGHNYVHPFETEEELKQAVAAYKTKLQETRWSGWIIKSAITSEVIYEGTGQD